METQKANRRQLGTIMVEEGFVTADQLEIALAEQARSARPLGAVLIEFGLASAGAVANALAEQHGGLLKTEYGISAGLTRRAVDPDATPERKDTLGERDARIAALEAEVASLRKTVELGKDQYVASALRYDELVSLYQSVVAERDGLAQRVFVAAE